MDHFRTLEQDPHRPEHTDVFLDLSEVDSLPETSQVSTVAGELKRMRGKVRFNACAILACRPALFGMMRIFEVLAEDCFRVTRTFKTATEAEAWLMAQQSQAEHKLAEREIRLEITQQDPWLESPNAVQVETPGIVDPTVMHPSRKSFY